MAGMIKKLTPAYLQKLVLEEKAKYEKDLKAVAAKTKEVDADEYAHTLEKEIDHLAVLKIKEGRLSAALMNIREEKKALHSKILRASRVQKKTSVK